MIYSKKKALKQLQKLRKYGKPLRLAAEWKEPWKSLIATMLSARTRDETTIVVCEKLFKKYATLEKLSHASIQKIALIIKPVNYYKTKAKNVSACTQKLIKEYKGKVPLEFDNLLTLPGVGRKTANVFLSEVGFDAIGVDTHVFQIARKLGWTKEKNPHKVEKDLKQLFPKKKWNQVNETLVRFGRTHRGNKQDEILKKILK